MGIKDTEVSLNTTEFKLFKKEKLVFGRKPEDIKGDTLYFDKSVTVIFGKNGSGKSTLSKRIKGTFSDECYLFNGFDGIVGEKKELNAVVLGTKNNEIEEQNKQEEAKINEIEKAIKAINREIEEYDENGNKYEDNLFAKRQQAIEAYKKQSGKLDNFYVASAKTIKEGLKIPNYNKNNFSEDLKSKKQLSDEERKNNEKLLENSTPRKASLLKETDFTPETLSDAVNGILQKSVKERIVIERLKDNPKKQAFAKEGLDLHEPGDKCAFCGHEIEGSVLEELHTYFSADEVKKFEEEIEGKLKEIETLKETIENMTIVEENFYPHLKAKAKDLCGRFKEEKLKVKGFLTKCTEALKGKKGNLFSSSEPLKDRIETSFSDIVREYNEAANGNNAIDVSRKLKEAENALRLDKVLKFCEEFHYETEAEKRKNLEVRKKDLEDAFEKKETEKKDKENEKEGILEKIKKSRAQTEDVSILAQHINDKLRGYVSFVLEYVGDREKKDGNYKIKDEGGYRDVTTLSTGEKNIIAFLYFLEKLKEADHKGTRENKIIVFDDPMNSNDDAMQYVMTEELRRLCRERKDDRVVIMTHNGHFYINLLYDWEHDKRMKDKVKRMHLRRLSSDGAEFNVIEKAEDDIKTCYQGLWLDLRFIYECREASPRLLLNQMRRIGETYEMFNGLRKGSFFSNASKDSNKLRNLGSHGLDDLEYEITYKEKEELMEDFRKDFFENNAKDHFNCLWKGTEKFNEKQNYTV